jgi:hypothetical protein
MYALILLSDSLKLSLSPKTQEMHNFHSFRSNQNSKAGSRHQLYQIALRPPGEIRHYV